MSGHGRRAALPPAGFRPQLRLRHGQDGLIVRFVAEDHGAGTKDYDFNVLPVGPALRLAFAQAFAERTRPGGPLRALASANKTYWRLTHFAGYLSTLNRPPERAGDLVPVHLDGWFLQRSSLASAVMELTQLKADLRKMPGISAQFAGKAADRNERRPPPKASTTYSRAEFDRILNAARTDIRRAAKRIRANRDLLNQWRAGQIDEQADTRRWRQGHVLSSVDRTADVARNASGKQPRDWVAELGTVTEHVTSLHLGPDEAVAFVVLLVGLTGQNKSTILTAPAAHHRPDGYTGPIPTAIVELDKPRRGANRHMDTAFVDLPAWVPTPHEQPTGTDAGPDDALDLRTPFGIYMLLHDLASTSRRIAGSDRLLVWWASRGGKGKGRGLRTGLCSNVISDWAAKKALPSDPVDGRSDPEPLRVLLPQLRLTRAEMHQKPVAHTDDTLANDYLLRNRGNIRDYQKVVADTLDQEVAKAKTRSALHILTTAEVELARTDPTSVAARHGMDPATLTKTINGELDTVMAACTDNHASPHTPPGRPCTASFMLCLSCPCARALPHHLPLQVAVHGALHDRRSAMTPLRWAQRYAQAHALLADLLDRAGSSAVADARTHLTDDQRDLASRFLNRELDLP